LARIADLHNDLHLKHQSSTLFDGAINIAIAICVLAFKSAWIYSPHRKAS